MDRVELLNTLQSALKDSTGVYVNEGVEEREYLSALASDIRSNLCEPFQLSAQVTAPGFPDRALGQLISGYCLAQRAGYWLVYCPGDHQFYCFWGTHQDNLGAPGVRGSPLYCWSA
jgi:hypothetical protein